MIRKYGDIQGVKNLTWSEYFLKFTQWWYSVFQAYCIAPAKQKTLKKRTHNFRYGQGLSDKIRWKKFYYSEFEIFINMLVRIGFAWFLHIEELLDVTLKHKITRKPLRNFNTKIKNRSTYVAYISRIKSECCPVKYLKACLPKAERDISNHSKARP